MSQFPEGVLMGIVFFRNYVGGRKCVKLAKLAFMDKLTKLDINRKDVYGTRFD